MERQSFLKRSFLPVAITAVVASLSWILYNLAWRMGSPFLHQTLAAISGSLLFVSVTFGAFYVYPTAYFRGAGVGERILASLITPWLWATKECLRLYISFSFAQCLYYYFNPLNIWLLFGLVAEMGLAELFCRWRLSRGGANDRIRPMVPLSAVVIGLCMVVFLISWGQGENAYVIFLKGFRVFFGSGL
jgi:hypothetical protein